MGEFKLDNNYFELEWELPKEKPISWVTLDTRVTHLEHILGRRAVAQLNKKLKYYNGDEDPKVVSEMLPLTYDTLRKNYGFGTNLARKVENFIERVGENLEVTVGDLE